MPSILDFSHPRLALFVWDGLGLHPSGVWAPGYHALIKPHVWELQRCLSGSPHCHTHSLCPHSAATALPIMGTPSHACWSIGMKSPSNCTAAIALRLVLFFDSLQESRRQDLQSVTLQGQEAQISMVTGSDSEFSYSFLVPKPIFSPCWGHSIT